MLFYTVMKPLVQVALRVFFRRLEIRHRDRLQTPGPLLMVSNHPNTLMDPLVVAANRRQAIAFLAKSTFFKNPVSKAVLTSGNSIPIYRRQDVETGAEAVTPEELAAQNEATFGKCYDYLGDGGTVMIFPEGTSVSERRLRPLKTGAARIALGAEARHNFKLGLRVLPVGINYFDPQRFRSDVLINVAPPIRVADYAAAYYQDPTAAADQLTEDIRRHLEQRLIITRDAAEDELVQQLESTFTGHLIEDDPRTLYDNFQLSRNLLQAVAYFEKHDPGHLGEVREKLAAYLKNLKRLKINDEALERTGRADTRTTRAIKAGLQLALGLPVYLYGALNNYLPYKLPSMVAKRATKEVEFVAPIMLVVGMITFSLGYAAQISLVHHFTQDWRWTLLYGLSLAPTGFYALYYANKLASRLRRLRALRLFRHQRPVMENLLRQRSTILRLLNEARQAYLQGVQ
ncbi:1-acyl-sn-glycerol-3-phosphate acyltransferase [Microvirga sp. STR05]|uniref:1-acyl-sn-glycerol-3-phosphate acyltransferase n=1 Tax=Hymenobacter duratus TaxID=2771356 RepID=A0ABR8JFX7_9BACT|nr:lysophospholipid acyltransferase family protein [Hymenobacter duratus]MBD2713439.1 1-acyl-sn-glycerol-3-phosphate acyltransferase [Hymenobacter duratus]MBR7948341.1 1-acyl-sn-glycerol-3-phosphate acyltransferase [Microvirga sp. STR05]